MFEGGPDRLIRATLRGDLFRESSEELSRVKRAGTMSRHLEFSRVHVQNSRGFNVLRLRIQRPRVVLT